MSREMTEKLEAAMWRNWALKMVCGAAATLAKVELYCPEAAAEVENSLMSLHALEAKLRAVQLDKAKAERSKPKPKRIWV